MKMVHYGWKKGLCVPEDRAISETILRKVT